ncbi:MAG: glutamate formimidoyltransferase [Spirochaetaceae bacterium]|jgi:glutamate formiminotransferase|nr:glutamate formimidoyltransferase [Spirochaetaceae bacterium]
MAKIVEFVPNFSEGRRGEVIDALAREAGSIPGVTLLDYSSDASHNRSVFTLAGDPGGIALAALRLCRLASEKIDLRNHTGEHPRMGASDVFPFIPVKEVTIEECIALSKKVAQTIWDELKIPSFLYERSASRPERENLAEVRKGQFEGMPEKLLLPQWAPDYGERKIHPSAGIIAIGARLPLVAFNVNLNTPDVKIAKAIAKTIRGSGGGYKYCKALGVMLEDRNLAQVSMNMVNCDGTPLYRVFEAIRSEARRYGVSIVGSEIIGLTPSKALADCAEYYLQIENFDYKKQVLENHLL